MSGCAVRGCRRHLRAHIDQLARKYTGGDYNNTIQSERVILKIAPTRQYVRRADHYGPAAE